MITTIAAKRSKANIVGPDADSEEKDEVEEQDLTST